MTALDPTGTTRFERVVLPHLDAAFTLACYLVRDVVEAEDAVQEALLRAVRHIDTLRSDADARAWLLTIVRRECASFFSARNTLANTSSVADVDESRLIDPAEGPDMAANRSMLHQRLRQAVDALPARLREVLILREIQDCSYQEIATITETPIGTVMSRLSRARARLAHSLGESLDFEELS